MIDSAVIGQDETSRWRSGTTVKKNISPGSGTPNPKECYANVLIVATANAPGCLASLKNRRGSEVQIPSVDSQLSFHFHLMNKSTQCPSRLLRPWSLRGLGPVWLMGSKIKSVCLARYETRWVRRWTNPDSHNCILFPVLLVIFYLNYTRLSQMCLLPVNFLVSLPLLQTNKKNYY